MKKYLLRLRRLLGHFPIANPNLQVHDPRRAVVGDGELMYPSLLAREGPILRVVDFAFANTDSHLNVSIVGNTS